MLRWVFLGLRLVIIFLFTCSRSLLLFHLLGCFLGHVLGLSLKVVLGEIATLAHAVGVVRLRGVPTAGGHLRLPLVLVAAVAHVLRISLLIRVGATHLVAHWYLRTALSDLQFGIQQFIIGENLGFLIQLSR